MLTNELGTLRDPHGIQNCHVREEEGRGISPLVHIPQHVEATPRDVTST